MTAREYFDAVRDAERHLWAIARKREHYNALAYGIHGMGVTQIRTLSQRSPVERAAVALADLDADLDEEERHYAGIIRAAEDVIRQIPQERLRMVLTLRYICNHSWRTISDEMGYRDPKSVYRCHGWALKAAETILHD